MNRYKKLLSNSLLFAIGNFGSKVINLIMVPLYTFVLSPGEYGTVDLIMTTGSLFLPLVSVSIGEALIRFVMEPSILEKEKNVLLSNAFFINMITSMLIICVYPILKSYNIFSDLLILFLAYLILSQFQSTFAQFVRGIGLIKEFALNGLIMTFCTASLNILLMVYYSMGIYGYLLSIVISNIVSLFYLCLVSKSYNRIHFKSLNKRTLKKMSTYSFPLIPNMIMWWLINSSTRYFILFFLNPTANGLFAVANKIPAVLSMFTTIFQQAWQLSAFEESEAKDKGNFFSMTFQFYYQFIFLSAAAVMPFIRPIIPKIIGASFVDSWKIIPLLLLAVTYQSFSSFIGTNYTTTMKTKGVFTSSIIGAITSVIANLIFIPAFGLAGAGIGTCVSFFVMFVIRYEDTKKLIGMKIEYKLFIINNLGLLMQIILMRVINSTIILFTLETVIFMFLLFINILNDREVIYRLINKKIK